VGAAREQGRLGVTSPPLLRPSAPLLTTTQTLRGVLVVRGIQHPCIKPLTLVMGSLPRLTFTLFPARRALTDLLMKVVPPAFG
jgi:hypothetical protein